MMEYYKVNEIFFSIQGEGLNSGRACVFIRMSGCDLDCPFCDTIHDSFKEMSGDELVNEVNLRFITAKNKHFKPLVVITGGEPSLQDCNPLIILLHDEGYEVAVETNGYDSTHISHADWVTYSPKEGSLDKRKWYQEMKIVYDGQDIDQYLDLLDSPGSVPILLQPMSNLPENITKCLGMIMKYPQIRLSLQVHKIIGVA
jgi:7-carboxy-7-deazaguanine synthase